MAEVSDAWRSPLTTVLSVYILYLSSIYNYTGKVRLPSCTMVMAGMPVTGRGRGATGGHRHIEHKRTTYLRADIFPGEGSHPLGRPCRGPAVALDQGACGRPSRERHHRAYSALESLGFIETVQGRGSFVARGNLELLREERLREVEGLLEQALADASAAGITVTDLHEMLDTLAEADM